MTHESLNSRDREIRVADLLPKSHCRPSPDSGPSSPTIQISLRKVSLNDSPPPEYTALSYVWGNPKDTIPILVDGVEFAATKNLVSALHQLQHEEEIVTLWVDAVCINQSDNDEKSWQIQLMKQIFEASVSTVVWLGDEADGSDKIMKMIADFAARPDFRAAIAGSINGTRTGGGGGGVINEYKQVGRMMVLDPCIPTDSSHSAFSSTQTSLTALLDREYWFRVWCLQEISVCRNTVVVCGNNGHRINVDLFGKVVYYYLELMVLIVRVVAAGSDPLVHIRASSPYLPKNLVKQVTGAKRMLEQRAKYRIAQGQAQRGRQEGGDNNRSTETSVAGHPELLQFLIGAYTNTIINVSLRSTDPRDMIYGLLNLAHDVEELGIVPDYNKTCTMVFLETWAGLLRKHGADLLVWAVPGGPQEDQVIVNDPVEALPSWVPDWRHPRLFNAFYHSKLFLACGPEHQDTEWVDTDSDDPRSIALKGVRVDVVQKIGTSLSRDTSQYIPSLIALIEKVTQFLEESSSSSSLPVYANPEALHTARWRIPLCDLEATSAVHSRTPATRATPASEEGFHSVLAVLESYVKNAAPEAVDGRAQWSVTLGQHLQKYISYSSVVFIAPCPTPFLTSSGWVGRGPAGMREGDIIAILWGSRIPLVLRPCGDGGEGKYQLVGDAYVHGLMDGEFLQDRAVREEEVFYLV